VKKMGTLAKENENIRNNIRILEESAESRSEERLDIDPLIRIGQHIRNRFLEASKPRGTKDAELTRLGNVAAHDVYPLADAMLYKHSYRNDSDTYKSLYGVSWETILRLQDSKMRDFLKVS
jgi:hypothetical protein